MPRGVVVVVVVRPEAQTGAVSVPRLGWAEVFGAWRVTTFGGQPWSGTGTLVLVWVGFWPVTKDNSKKPAK